MTFRKSTPEQMRKILDIRKVQRMAAEAQAARANAALNQKRSLQEEAQQDSQSAQASWLTAVTSSSLPLEIAPLWMAAVQSRDAALQSASRETQNAELARDNSAAALRTAEQRHDVAEEMSQRAMREHLRDLEEEALHRATEQHLQRKAL